MKRIRIYLFDLMIIVLELVIGFLLIISPAAFTRGIIIAFGVLLMLFGVASVIQYFRTEPQMAALQKKLAQGVGSFVLGLVLGIRSQWFVEFFPMLTSLYGIALLAVAIIKLQRIVDFLRMKKQGWYLEGIGTLLLTVLGVLLLVNPFETVKYVWPLIAVVLFIDAALTLATIIVSSREKDDEGEQMRTDRIEDKK